VTVGCPGGTLLEIGAGAERGTGVGQHDHTRTTRGRPDLVEAIAELAHEWRDSAFAVGLGVERDRGDPALDIELTT
jgi:hypothetical protein